MSCSNNNQTDNISHELIDNGAQIHVVGGDLYDFGQIVQGEKIQIEFEIQNIGVGDLIITDIKTSCGCTNPIWNKSNISSGEKENILVTFDSKGRYGKQTKKITLATSSTPSFTVLTVTGNVVEGP